MQSKKLSPSVLSWFSRSWQTYLQWPFCFYSCVIMYGTHLAQTLQYSNVAKIISDTLKLTLSSVHSFLVIIHWFALHFESRHLCQTACNVTCHSHCCLHCWNTLLIIGFHIHCLVSINTKQVAMNVKKNWMRCFCFIWIFISFYQTSVMLLLVTRKNKLLMGRFNFTCHTTSICFWYHRSA